MEHQEEVLIPKSIPDFDLEIKNWLMELQSKQNQQLARYDRAILDLQQTDPYSGNVRVAINYQEDMAALLSGRDSVLGLPRCESSTILNLNSPNNSTTIQQHQQQQQQQQQPTTHQPIPNTFSPSYFQ